MDPINAPFGTAPTPAAAEPRRSALASDFDTFLRMLTAQAQNQDPLNPIDATDYATQLATFSTVEQQVTTNELLGRIADAVGASALERLRDYVGTEVLAPAAAAFDGEPIPVHAEADPRASETLLVVRNENGDEVARRRYGAGPGPLTWDGRDGFGNLMPAGRYRFDIESLDGEVSLGTQPGRVFVRVEEARVDAGTSLVLHLADGSEIEESEVSSVRVR